MREHEVEKALKDAIEKAEVGKEVNVSLSSISSVIDVDISVEEGGLPLSEPEKASGESRGAEISI
jgi:TusA-related sulfurtransferase